MNRQKNEEKRSSSSRMERNGTTHPHMHTFRVNGPCGAVGQSVITRNGMEWNVMKFVMRLLDDNADDKEIFLEDDGDDESS